MEMKKLPIGVEFFEHFKRDNFYYVDKTGFIRDLMNTRGSVNLFTRPRRFGKSLNMDMLKTFFEIGTDPSLFDGLEIAEDDEFCEQYMGRYPVISISLKDVEGMDYQVARAMLGSAVSEEAGRFGFLLGSDRLTKADKKKLNRLIEEDFGEASSLYHSLRLLTQLLFKHYGIPVIVLLDEYDVPLDKAYQNGYYSQMVVLIRSLFSQVLKTNKNLYFAVITGCLRIAKESIFTGLNNFKVRTISDIDCAKYFGFTDHEVREMLRYYGVEDRFADVKEWYDGYHFGKVDVYCPWDVINQCDKMRVRIDSPMESHWENSSSNAIVRDIIEKATEATKAEIEALISGEYIEKPIIPELTYTDLDSRDESLRQTYLWSVLYSTGYLTDFEEPVGKRHKLVIPNKEVFQIYQDRIYSWFKVKVTGHTEQWQIFCLALETGDARKVQSLFNDFLGDSISIRDTSVRKEMKENFYHGMLLGLLTAEGRWLVKSNVESGVGYTDIMVEIPAKDTGCVIEMKYAENGHFDSACDEAMKQIEDGEYVTALRMKGIQTIHKYGIACYKKCCRVAYSLLK
ncbi:AAA family ATPase [Lachnospiraceae bacterium 56-18]